MIYPRSQRSGLSWFDCNLVSDSSFTTATFGLSHPAPECSPAVHIPSELSVLAEANSS